MDETKGRAAATSELTAGLEPLPKAYQKGWIYTTAQMREYAAQCVAAEREACAKAAEATPDKHGTNDDGRNWLTRATKHDCAKAIRARGSNAQVKPQLDAEALKRPVTPLYTPAAMAASFRAGQNTERMQCPHCNDQARDEIVRLRSALAELTALVRGECGALLDEDRGGSASLSMEIDDLLTPNAQAQGRSCSALLGARHTGMRISASGVLGRIRDGRYNKGMDYGCGVMLEHLEEMATRFYTGDPKAVDEFLQLYDLDDARPETPNAR